MVKCGCMHFPPHFPVDTAPPSLHEAPSAGQLLPHAQSGIHPGQQLPPHAAHSSGSGRRQPGEWSVFIKRSSRIPVYGLIYSFYHLCTSNGGICKGRFANKVCLLQVTPSSSSSSSLCFRPAGSDHGPAADAG